MRDKESQGERDYLDLLRTSFGEGNSNLLQHSCLEVSVDRGAWLATVHGVAKSQTRLSVHTHKNIVKFLDLAVTWWLTFIAIPNSGVNILFLFLFKFVSIESVAQNLKNLWLFLGTSWRFKKKKSENGKQDTVGWYRISEAKSTFLIPCWVGDLWPLMLADKLLPFTSTLWTCSVCIHMPSLLLPNSGLYLPCHLEWETGLLPFLKVPCSLLS